MWLNTQNCCKRISLKNLGNALILGARSSTVIKDLTAMLSAFFLRVAFYCLLTTAFPIFNLGSILSWIEEGIRKLGMVDLQLNYIYGSLDFQSKKRYLSPTPSYLIFS